MKKDKQTTTKNTDITGRKRADEEASRMITVVRDSNDAIMIQDYEGKILAWNYGAEHLFGYSEQEALQMTIWQLAPPDKVAEQKDFNRRIFAGEKVVSFETQRLAKDGRLLDIWLTVTKLVDETGKVIGIASTERDITERKRKEEEAKSAKSLLDTVIDSSPFAMWISDREGMLIRTNRSLRETLNLTDEQLIGKYNVLNDVNLEMQGVMPMVRAVFEMNTPARFTIPWKASNAGDVDFKGGRDLYIDVSIFPILDNDGKLTNVVCQWVDITERKRAEEAVTVSELRYRRLFEAARDGILILDADSGMVVDVNPFLMQLLGYSRDTFLGRKIWELGFFKDTAANKVHLTELLQKEYIQYEDMPLETVSGRLINVEFVSHVYEVDRHRVIQCNIRDITERRRVEEKILHQLEELRRWQEVTLGREDRVRQLKSEVNQLLGRLGETVRYPSQEGASEDQETAKG